METFAFAVNLDYLSVYLLCESESISPLHQAKVGVYAATLCVYDYKSLEQSQSDYIAKYGAGAAH